MARPGEPNDDALLSAAERRAVRELSESLATHRVDGGPVLARFVEDLRSLVGAQTGLSVGSGHAGDGFALTFSFSAGHLPDVAFVPDLDTWMHRSPSRWALYDPVHPEPRQRNTVINVGHYLTLLEHQADAAPLRAFGVDTAAVDTARERLTFTESLPGMRWLVRRHQLRTLICDGPRMLAWVGVVDSAPFSSREVALLEGLVPALQRSLAFERKLETASLHARAFDVAIDALPDPAFLIDDAGRIQHANALGRAWHSRDPRELSELLTGAARGEPNGFTSTPLVSDGQPRHLLAIWQRSSPDLRSREEAFSTRFGLTPRERQVASLLFRGKSNKEIAAELTCAPKTVELHVTHVLQKTRTSGRAELAARFWSGEATGA